MPQVVTKEIKVRDLRKGDRFVDASTPDTGTPVTTVTRKTKWALVELGERTVRVELDADVTVLREEPTQEEKDASARKFMTSSLRRYLREMLECDPATVLTEIIDNHRARAYDGELLTWSNTSDVLCAQALYCQAIRIRRVVNELDGVATIVDPDDVDNVDDETLLRAYASWFLGAVKSVHDRYGPSVNPLSRSTSPISNILEDLDRWAVERILSDVVMSGAYDELERRADAAREESRR